LEDDIAGFQHFEEYVKRGIEVIENTPAEISDVVNEMDERLKGAWQETEEDKELQYRFWELMKLDNLDGKTLLRIGADFLRKNRELLY
jgi:putative glycosyltransferase (TIGR04372 family)